MYTKNKWAGQYISGDGYGNIVHISNNNHSNVYKHYYEDLILESFRSAV